MFLPRSVHEFRRGERVTRDGAAGTVVEARALVAIVRWEYGREEEIEQLDGAVFVELPARASSDD